MRPPTLLILAALAVVPAGLAGAVNAEVDDVIGKHIEAKGGRANWDKIESLRATGDFTAFSKVAPFTLHRARGNKYHLDHTMNGGRLVIGYDGDSFWWDNFFFQAGPQPITDAVNLAALEREIELRTPLFDYKERGFEAELVEGETNFEGILTVAIQLKRTDDSVETWHLDPDTFLEVARESPGSDFGRPMPSRTIFDEFREVQGAMIPHWIESQWYTRHRIMDIQELEVNVDLDSGLFSMPLATGMALFQKVLGEWDVKVESKQDPRQPEFDESSRASLITASLNGGLVEERYTDKDGVEATRAFSYDRYRDHYVLTQMNSAQTYMDMQTGQFDGDSLIVSNVESGTSFDVFGATLHERCTLSNVSEDGFSLQVENSTDGGENWAISQKLTYARKSPESD
ncbi:MAG: DUF1579 domain-containing protein [Acidobacteriota bacterium]|nr:DUF1579 domain-containing protein [Acidobacteriota bacterium]